MKIRGVMIIVVGDTPSSVEINARGRIGDPSKMAAAQYVSSNRQRQSMARLPIYVNDGNDVTLPRRFAQKW